MEIILSLQLQMEKLPSRKAITEMISWMNNVEHQTADEDSERSLSSASQVKNLLQKYKVIKQKEPEALSLNKKASQSEGKYGTKRHIGCDLEKLILGARNEMLGDSRQMLAYFFRLVSCGSSHHRRTESKLLTGSDPSLPLQPPLFFITR